MPHISFRVPTISRRTHKNAQGQQNHLARSWVGLGWVGLGWVGLGWVGLGWVGLGWVGLRCVALRRGCVGGTCTGRGAHFFCEAPQLRIAIPSLRLLYMLTQKTDCEKTETAGSPVNKSIS